MKTAIKTIALSLLVFTVSNFAFAGERLEKAVSPELNVQIAQLANNQVAVVFGKLEGELVKVKIYDSEGDLIHTDKENEGTAYGKRFNLKYFPAGKYTYVVSNDVYSITKVIDQK